MPRRADCARCHQRMVINKNSRPAGEATCQPCRATLREERERDVQLLRLARPIRLVNIARRCDMSIFEPTEYRVCPCGATFEVSRPNQKYCRPEHRPDKRESTTQRGYGSAHRRERAKWADLMAEQGYLECHALACLMHTRSIGPHEPWDLGHTLDRSGWTGPEHRHCNRKEPQSRVGPTKPRTPRRWQL